MTETANLGTTDYVVVIGYFGVMISVGLYFSTRMHSLKDFFGGGQSTPWWLAGISYYMSSFSAFTFVAYSALAYQYGWVAVTLYWVTVPSALFSAFFLASRWRRAATISPLEYIEKRFGLLMRQVLAWITIPMRLVDDALKLFAIGTLVSGSFGFPLGQAVFISGVIVLAYTLLGGLWAVLVTDFIQFVVMFAVIVVLLPLAFQRAGGFGAVIEGAPDGFFDLTNPLYSWSYLLAFLVIQILFSGSTWALVQRFYSVKNDSDARKVGFTVAVLNVFGPPLIFAPAMAARLFLPEGTNPDHVYVDLCLTLLPVGMVGMVITAMFAATMSMLSSGYNSYASVLTNDVYLRFFGSAKSDRALVVAGRLATLLVGALSLVLAFLILGARGEADLFAIMVQLFSICLPPIALPMLAGLLTRRVSNSGALTGLLSGTLCGLAAFSLGGEDNYPLLRSTQVMVLLTVVSTILGMALGTWSRPGSQLQKRNIEAFFEKMGRKDRIPSEHGATTDPVLSPLPIISVSLLALGILLIASVFATLSIPEGKISLLVGTAITLLGGVLFFLQSQAAQVSEADKGPGAPRFERK